MEQERLSQTQDSPASGQTGVSTSGARCHHRGKHGSSCHDLSGSLSALRAVGALNIARVPYLRVGAHIVSFSDYDAVAGLHDPEAASAELSVEEGEARERLRNDGGLLKQSLHIKVLWRWERSNEKSLPYGSNRE